MYPFERFSESAKGVLMLAQREAEHAGHSYIGTEHLLLGLIGREDGLAAAALTNLGVDSPSLRTTLERVLLSAPPSPLAQITPTSRVKRIIEMAFVVAQGEHSPVVDTGHLLIAIVDEGHGIAAQVLAPQVDAGRIRKEIAALREAGQADNTKTPVGSATDDWRRIDVPDEEGHVVRVDILFPPEYSEERRGQVTARIKAAVVFGNQ